MVMAYMVMAFMVMAQVYYFANGWNALDFLIVVSGWVVVFLPFIPSLTLLRVLTEDPKMSIGTSSSVLSLSTRPTVDWPQPWHLG